MRGKTAYKPRSTRSPSSKALLGLASEWVSGRDKCQAVSQTVRARRAYRRGEEQVRLIEMRFELVENNSLARRFRFQVGETRSLCLMSEPHLDGKSR